MAWQQSERPWITTLDTSVSGASSIDSHALVSAYPLWQKLQSALAPPHMPSMQALAEKSWPGNALLTSVVDMVALSAVSGPASGGSEAAGDGCVGGCGIGTAGGGPDG